MRLLCLNLRYVLYSALRHFYSLIFGLHSLQSLIALADIIRLSPSNQEAFADLLVTPLIPPIASTPYPSHNGNNSYERSSQEGRTSADGREREEGNETRWRRGEEVSAVVALTSLAILGDGTRGRDGLRVRAGAAALFAVRDIL